MDLDHLSRVIDICRATERLLDERDVLRKQLAERDRDTAYLRRAIQEVPGWSTFEGTPSSTVGVAAAFIRARS